MQCRIIELRDKQVVSVKDGSVIGYVSDIEIDTANGSLTASVVAGKSHGFALLGRSDDIVVPWNSIEVIGHDSILVNIDIPLAQPRKRKNAFSSFFFGE